MFNYYIIINNQIVETTYDNYSTELESYYLEFEHPYTHETRTDFFKENEVFQDYDSALAELNKRHTKTLKPIIDAKLPGFYLDITDSLSLIYFDTRVSCYVDETDNTWVISSDMFSNETGCFDLNTNQTTCNTPKETIQEIKNQLRQINNRFNNAMT